eukprot:Seg588.3 transcript_id=Seg588.3/GoldUCD/mRNA.D3Y31 product="hypothetical protein" protein_id=Seg588.3/GoldUCD/D3Y31
MAADVQVEVTDRIKESMHDLPDKSFLDHIKYPDSCPRGVIEYKIVSQIFSELKKANTVKYKYFHEFLEGSNIYEEPLQEPKKSPELLKRLERLKAQAAQKKYDAMVKNVSAQNKQSFGSELGGDVRSTSKQLMSVLNFLLTIFGSVFFAYFASEFAWNDFGVRLIFSIVVGTVVALAELYFLARTEI